MSSRSRASDWMHSKTSDSEEDIQNSDSEDQKPTTKKRSRTLYESDDDLRGSESENEVLESDEEIERPLKKKVKGKSGSKSFGIEEEEEEEDESDEEFEDAEEGYEDDPEFGLPPISEPINLTKSSKKSKTSSTLQSTTIPSHSKLSSIIDSTAKKSKKTGIVYLSRLPPYMSPSQLRHHLSAFGEINRIFLSPESPQTYQRRIKSGGNKKRRYEEGWVEFLNKKHAKFCTESLNANQIGGKKGGWWYDDVWNMKYLRGFKWGDLMEQIANENAARQARLRAEISQATKENKAYIQNVERAKMVENMQASAKEKRKKAGADDSNKSAVEAEPVEIRRTFKQRTAVTKRANEDGSSKPKSDAMKKLLSSVF